MQKYREHTQQGIKNTKLDLNKLIEKCTNCKCTAKIEAQARQLDCLASMVSELMKDGSKEFSLLLEENEKLKTENKYLRLISKQIHLVEPAGKENVESSEEEAESSSSIDISGETVQENLESNDD